MFDISARNSPSLSLSFSLSFLLSFFFFFLFGIVVERERKRRRGRGKRSRRRERLEQLCISGYSSKMAFGDPTLVLHSRKSWKPSPPPLMTMSPFAKPPSIEEMSTLVMGISDEEAMRAQVELRNCVLCHVPRDLAELVLRYSWEPKDFVGAPIMIAGVKHMFLNGEKERLCYGVSLSATKTGVLAYKTRTKLLVAAFVLPSPYVPAMVWSSVMKALESLEFDMHVAGI